MPGEAKSSQRRGRGRSWREDASQHESRTCDRGQSTTDWQTFLCEGEEEGFSAEERTEDENSSTNFDTVANNHKYSSTDQTERETPIWRDAVSGETNPGPGGERGHEQDITPKTPGSEEETRTTTEGTCKHHHHDIQRQKAAGTGQREDKNEQSGKPDALAADDQDATREGKDQRSGTPDDVLEIHGDDGSAGNGNPNEQPSSFVSQKRGGGRGTGNTGKRVNGGKCVDVRMGFVNCRGWWSKEVDINMLLKQLDLDVLGLAETFLQRDDEPDVAGYTWFGNNRIGGKRASGGVGLFVREGIQARILKKDMDGVLWVEVETEEGDNCAFGIIYANPEGIRVDKSEEQCEVIQLDAMRWRELGYYVILMGDFNAHIGAGEEERPSQNGRRLLNLTWA